MAESKSKSSDAGVEPVSAPPSTGGPQDAPGPISPEHESGSSAITEKVDKARQALRDAEKAPAKS